MTDSGSGVYKSVPMVINWDTSTISRPSPSSTKESNRFLVRNDCIIVILNPIQPMFFVVRTGLSENKVFENPVRYHHFPHLNRNFWGCNQPPGAPIASCSPELSTARNLAGKCVHCQVRIMAMGENMFSNPGSSELGLEL